MDASGDDPRLAAALARVSTATLTTLMLKAGLRSVWLHGPRRMAKPGRVAGRA